MNIPKEAIETAIAGGWKGTREIFTGETNLGETVYNRVVALDPTFWQALGKALGWDEGEIERELFPKWPWHWMWQHLAHEYYDLILTQRPTDAAFPSELQAFWKELLVDN